MNKDSIGEKLIELLKDGGVPFKVNSSNEIIFYKCYNCGRENKLYAGKDSGLFQCFRCNEKGNAVKLIAKYLLVSYKEAQKMLYGNEKEPEDVSIESIKKQIIENEENHGLSLQLGGFYKSVKKELNLPDPIQMDDEFVILSQSTNIDAWNYLINRGYTPEIIKRLKLYVCPYLKKYEYDKFLEKKYKKELENVSKEEELVIKQKIKDKSNLFGRIIFPLYIDSEIYGYVARDYTGKVSKKYKAINSRGNFRSFFIWNYDIAKSSDELIICEGTTSAIKCGIDRSIALLGKKATELQLKLIRKMKAKKIYLCLDMETDDEQAKIIEYLNVFYIDNIYKIILPPVVKKPDCIFSDAMQNLFKSFNIIIQENLIYIESKTRNNIIKNFENYVFDYNLSNDDQEILNKILDADYLDAGDYSFEEMEKFKQNAVKV